MKTMYGHIRASILFAALMPTGAAQPTGELRQAIVNGSRGAEIGLSVEEQLAIG